MTPPLLRVY